MIVTILNDTHLKKVAKRKEIIHYLLENQLNVELVKDLNLSDKQMVIVLEALEEISRQQQLSQDYLLLIFSYIKSSNNSCKREALRILGNLVAYYPELIQNVLPDILDSTKDASTVIRWAAAYLLSRALITPFYSTSELVEQIVILEALEEETGVKKQYTKALKKLRR